MWNHYGSETYSISVTQRSENLLRITHRTRPIMLCIPRLRKLTEFLVKFIHSEKARKIWGNLPHGFDVTKQLKTMRKIVPNFCCLQSNSWKHFDENQFNDLSQLRPTTENLNFSSKGTYRRVSNIEFLSIEREKILKKNCTVRIKYRVSHIEMCLLNWLWRIEICKSSFYA